MREMGQGSHDGSAVSLLSRVGRGDQKGYQKGSDCVPGFRTLFDTGSVGDIMGGIALISPSQIIELISPREVDHLSNTADQDT